MYIRTHAFTLTKQSPISKENLLAKLEYLQIAPHRRQKHTRYDFKDCPNLSINFNPSDYQQVNKFIFVASGQCSAKQRLSSRAHCHTTETGRLFFRRRAKEFPLAIKVIVFGLVSKKMLAQKANAPDNIPSHFLARALALVVVYSLSFSNNMIQLQAFCNISFLFFYF